MDSSPGIATPVAGQTAAAPAADPSYLAAAVLRLEQALAATSKGISDRIGGEASAAVQVEPEPRPADPITADVPAVSLERAKLPEVARLEDLLTVAPADRVAPAPTVPVETTAPVSSPPAEELERPASDADQAPEPLYVAAQALREAFWFEQASAFKAATSEITAPEAVAEPVRLESVPPPTAQPDSPQSAPEPVMAPASRSRWIAAMWVIALIALVAALRGRARRRSI